MVVVYQASYLSNNGPKRSTLTHKQHFRCHDGHELHVGREWQARHVKHCFSNLLDVPHDFGQC